MYREFSRIDLGKLETAHGHSCYWPRTLIGTKLKLFLIIEPLGKWNLAALATLKDGLRSFEPVLMTHVAEWLLIFV